MTPRPDLLSCVTVADLIGAWMSRQRLVDPHFSGRAFARVAGERNLTIVHSVAAGDRRLTLAQLARWLPHMALRPIEREHLLSLVRRDEAEAELHRLKARAVSIPSPDAETQIRLQEQRVERVRAEPEGATQMVRRAEGAFPRVLPGIDGERSEDVDTVLGRTIARRVRLDQLATQHGETAAGARPPLFGLTEAVSTDQIARLRAEIQRSAVDLQSVQEADDEWTVHLCLFPLSRALGEAPSSGAPPRDEAASTAPSVLDWIAPEVGGARAWLGAWMRWRQSIDPGFGYADFARLCDQPDRAILWKILHRRQGLTPTRARAFARGLGLDDDEEDLLALLADRDRCPTPEARALLQPAIDQRAAQVGASVLTLRRARLLSGWAPYAIHELAACAGFHADPAWMAAALEDRIAPQEVERALEMLFSARMLEALPAGLRPVAARWQLDRPAHATLPEGAVLRYHQAMAEQERRALLRWQLGARDPVVLTLGVKTCAHPDTLYMRLQALFERLQGLCAGAETRTRVVQICLHGWRE